MTNTDSLIAVIGAGPAGLMAAEVIAAEGFSVHVYDAMPSAGRKFLMAGKGGMNITHAEELPDFLSRYGARSPELDGIIRHFSPDALRAWVCGLGFKTFVGTSGRVFPTDMKSAPLLRTWLHRLRETGVKFHMRHRWLGFDGGRKARFDTPDGELLVDADAIVLALGGGSWPQLGSTGDWFHMLVQQGIDIAPLRPANCGFDLAWSDHFRERFAGEPLKSVVIAFTGVDGKRYRQQGELMVSDYGLEGGLIYALSAPLRETLMQQGWVDIEVDLLPDRTLSAVIDRLSQPRGKASLANFLRKRLGLDAVKIAILRESPLPLIAHDSQALAKHIKALPLRLVGIRPIEEAISSAGGVRFDELDDNLMLHKLQGVFCAGEMLDWEAPTGGYLLTACLATGRAAGKGAAAWLASRRRYG